MLSCDSTDELLFPFDRVLFCALFAVGLLAVFSIPVAAIEPGGVISDHPPVARSQYIEAVADDEPYSLVVIGDSIGNGLWHGLTYRFRGDDFIRIVKKSKVSTGLVRTDYFDWPEALDEILQRETFQIAVVLFGTNDRQAIRTQDAVFRIGTPGWKALYRARVDRIMEQLKAKNVAIYWVGLPIMRSPSFARHANLVNLIVSASAAAHHVKFVDTWEQFADDRGRYNAFGPDVTGRKRKLRDVDGIHLTRRGYLKLALTVEKMIRQDLGDVAAQNGEFHDAPPILPTLRPKRNAGFDLKYFVANLAN